MRAWIQAACLGAVVSSGGCAPYGTILARNIEVFAAEPRKVPNRITTPHVDGARLVASWVGHATVLVQIDDKHFLTDPVFTSTVGQLSRRLVEPGIDAANMPKIDVALVSHMHVDHLSLGSLDGLESKIDVLCVPSGGSVYIPNYDFPVREVRRWSTESFDGVRVTAVSVAHAGWRFGADAAWALDSFTGWVVEYHGVTVYFAGDTAFDARSFTETARRFPAIDLALLPIGPVEPHDLARANHIDGREALRAFELLGARHMVPIHYDTFPHGLDAEGDALRVLREAQRRAGVGDDRVHPLAIGGRRAFTVGRGSE